MTPFEAPIDARNGVPYYRQIIDRVMLGLAAETLGTGDKLPTVRSLAVELKVNPNTVARAYRDLEAGGVVETRRGSGTYIAARRPRMPSFERERQLEQLCAELVTNAQGLGFSVDELIATLQEMRRGSRASRSRDEDTPNQSKKSRTRTGL